MIFYNPNYSKISLCLALLFLLGGCFQRVEGVVGDEGSSPYSPAAPSPNNNCRRANEVWSAEGSWCCQPTCQHSVCNKMCMQGGGCVCAEGFKRDESHPGSPCVPAEKCPPPIPFPSIPPTKQHNCPGEHEEWHHCKMVRCEPSCANRKPMCPLIKMVCLPSMDVGQCECKAGYIRENPSIGARCIPEDECKESSSR